MDVNDYAFGNGVVDPNQQKMMAEALRQRDAQGAIMALTGDRTAAPVGEQFMKSATTQRQQVVNHNYYQGMLRQQEAALKQRAHEADLNHKAQMARTNTMAAKGPTYRPIPAGIQDKLLNGQSTLTDLARLAETRDPKWDSKYPGSNALRTAVGQYAPMFATEEQNKLRQWQADFEGWYTANARHDLYGGALTSTEVKNWVKQALAPDASAEQVRGYIGNIMSRLAPLQAARVNMNARAYGPGVYEDMAMFSQDGPVQEEEPDAAEEPEWEVLED